jgi:hypothetical protein
MSQLGSSPEPPEPPEPRASDQNRQSQPVTQTESQTVALPIAKVADRPHWVTIALNSLSPSIALVALIFGAQSFKLSERALSTSLESR